MLSTKISFVNPKLLLAGVESFLLLELPPPHPRRAKVDEESKR
jgi:hypothetical protein